MRKQLRNFIIGVVILVAPYQHYNFEFNQPLINVEIVEVNNIVK